MSATLRNTVSEPTSPRRRLIMSQAEVIRNREETSGH